MSRISDLSAIHYAVNEPDYTQRIQDRQIVTSCYEDSALWPCDTGYLLDQLAAESAARLAAEQEVRTVWFQFRFQDAAKATAQAELHATRAQLAARDRQIAALWEARQAALLALDADCRALCDSNTSSAPCSCWPDRLDRARRALLAPPAATASADREGQ